MTRSVLLFTAFALGLSTAANAGGPVIVAEEPPVVAEEAASSGGILPLVLVGIALCVALCGGNGDDRPRRQPPS